VLFDALLFSLPFLPWEGSKIDRCFMCGSNGPGKIFGDSWGSPLRGKGEFERVLWTKKGTAAKIGREAINFPRKCELIQRVPAPTWAPFYPIAAEPIPLAPIRQDLFSA